ncbi:hypothetical protein TNCT_536671 [Trichonephila clavata]|uniref:Uncharacterized protein n=1 Tax=Trichonephila clavata TaxID=2740835 RepID=A0A8X6L7H9_TRICU|nr:hypothetical protein TNCT_536671 [Trichonephila clavata]
MLSQNRMYCNTPLNNSTPQSKKKNPCLQKQKLPNLHPTKMSESSIAQPLHAHIFFYYYSFVFRSSKAQNEITTKKNPNQEKKRNPLHESLSPCAVTSFPGSNRETELVDR